VGQLPDESVAQEVNRAVREEEIRPTWVKTSVIGVVVVLCRRRSDKTIRPHICADIVGITKVPEGLPCRWTNVSKIIGLSSRHPLADEEGIACPICDIRNTNKGPHFDSRVRENETSTERDIDRTLNDSAFGYA